MTQCTNVPMISAHDWYKHPMYQSWAEMIGTLVHWYIGTLVHWYIGTLVHWFILCTNHGPK